MKKTTNVFYGLVAAAVALILMATIWVVTGKRDAYSYAPRLWVSQHEFLLDQQALALHWQEDTTWLADLNPLAAHQRYTGEMDSFSQHYLVNQTFKLRGDAMDYQGEGQADEQWYLDVYAIKKGELELTSYDLFEQVAQFDARFLPNQVIHPLAFRYKDKEYAHLMIRHTLTGSKEAVMLDLSNGQVVAQPKDAEAYRIERNQSDRLYQLGVHERLADQGVQVTTNEFLINDDPLEAEQWLLKTQHPEVFDWLLQTRQGLLILNSTISVQDQLALAQLFFPEGTNLYQGMTLPASLTKDKKVHKIKNAAEFDKYYQATGDKAKASN